MHFLLYLQLPFFYLPFFLHHHCQGSGCSDDEDQEDAQVESYIQVAATQVKRKAKKSSKSSKIPSVRKEGLGSKVTKQVRTKQDHRRVSDVSSPSVGQDSQRAHETSPVLDQDFDVEYKNTAKMGRPRGGKPKKVGRDTRSSTRRAHESDASVEDMDNDGTDDYDSDDHQDYREQLERLQKEHAQLLQKAADAPETRVSYARFPPKNDKDDPNKKLIKEIIKVVIWRRTKFLTSDDQEETLALEVYAAINIANKGVEGHEKAFVEHNKAFITSELNEMRSYVQTNAKDFAAYPWMAANNGHLPTVDEVFACVTRQPLPVEPVAKTRAELVWVWYWDEYLPRIAGNRFHWSTAKRHYELISESPVTTQVGNPTASRSSAKKPTAKGKKKAPVPLPAVPLNIPPSTEAFGMVLYESCFAKWQHEFPLKQAHPNKKISFARPPKGKENLEYEVVGKRLYLYDKKYRGLYTKSDAGRGKFRGWTAVGMARFIKHREDIVKVRDHKDHKAATLDLENAILELVREKHGIVAQDIDDEKNAKRRKTEDPEDVVKELVALNYYEA